MGSRKKQDLLSKLGAWGSWKRVEEEGEGKEGSGENIYNSIKTIFKITPKKEKRTYISLCSICEEAGKKIVLSLLKPGKIDTGSFSMHLATQIV